MKTGRSSRRPKVFLMGPGRNALARARRDTPGGQGARALGPSTVLGTEPAAAEGEDRRNSPCSSDCLRRFAMWPESSQSHRCEAIDDAFCRRRSRRARPRLAPETLPPTVNRRGRTPTIVFGISKGYGSSTTLPRLGSRVANPFALIKAPRKEHSLRGLSLQPSRNRLARTQPREPDQLLAKPLQAQGKLARNVWMRWPEFGRCVRLALYQQIGLRRSREGWKHLLWRVWRRNPGGGPLRQADAFEAGHCGSREDQGPGRT